MASFRVSLRVGELRAAIPPELVLPRIAAACGEIAVVEASDVQLVAGSPRLVVRFEAVDDADAARIAAHTVRAALEIIIVEKSLITRRVRGKWLPLAP